VSIDDMSGYDRKAWAEVEAWRDRRLNTPQRHVLPHGARHQLTKLRTEAQDRLNQMPGADAFQGLFFKAVDGLVGMVNRMTIASVRRQAVVAAYAKRGHPVAEISDIGKLELRDIDKVKPRLELHYTLASTVEGAGAGLAVSGGEFFAVGETAVSAGVGAAPGAGTVIGIMAADAVAVLVAATRAVAHTAAYYGYDTELADERLYALGVLNFGLAEQAGKTAAYIELNKIVQDLARRAAWDQLDKNVVTQIVKTVYARLGEKITKEKLAQALPVVGIVIGAGLNARILARVTSDAEHLYRERFLREKHGLVAASPTALPPGAASDSDSIPIVDIVDAELVAEAEGDGGRDTPPT
jgi:EcsC protein family